MHNFSFEEESLLIKLALLEPAQKEYLIQLYAYIHRVETEEGDYMFCFDNTFSTISEKVIFFELILDNMGEEGQDQEDWKKYVTGTDLLDMKLEDILVSTGSLVLLIIGIIGKKCACHSALIWHITLETVLLQMKPSSMSLLFPNRNLRIL